MKGLNLLKLKNINVCFEAAQELSRLQYLRILGIHSNQLTNRLCGALFPCQENGISMRKLESLSLYETLVTADVLKQVMSSLPALK